MTLLGEGAGPIRVLVVDDEPLARRNLTVLLEADADIGEIAECGSGAEALTIMRHAMPDLLFLDVQMPECGGFDVLELMGPEQPRAIVFVTAYDAYALRAFEAGALDYLLKPFDDARFARALARAKRIVAQGGRSSTSVRRYAVKSTGQLRLIDFSSIDWIEAASYYACLHVGAEAHLIRRPLSQIEQDLRGEPFLRIHRSTIVNLDRVRALELQSSGEYEVALTTGARLRASRSHKNLLHRRLKTTPSGP